MAARFPRCVALAALLAAGCSEPEAVRVHDETPPTRPPVVDVPADQKKFRTLAALVPADNPTDGGQNWWVFKFSGPAAPVGEYAADFDKILASVRVGGEEPVTWTLPDKWTKGPDRDGGIVKRYATLVAPDGKSEIAVTQASGTVFMNVQRWYGQVRGKDREPEVTAANLYDYARRRTIHNRLVVTVDLAGPKDPNAAMAKPTNPHHPHGGQ